MENTKGKSINTPNKQQCLARELITKTNSSFFLTGRAGTGKTTFIREIRKNSNKQFLTLAPTGIAAIMVGGETIHSFFGLPMEVCTPGTFGTMGGTNILSLLHTDTIIIDEVSMVRCDVIDAIDLTMRRILHSNLPFGGKQIVFVGDMFQLPPIVKSGAERELLTDLYKTNDFFFYKANVIRRMRLVKIEFQQIYRQEDEQFLHVLDHVRLNKATSEDFKCLNRRVCAPSEDDGNVITLTSINKIADSINQKRLSEINSEEFEYKGIVNGKFEEKRFPADMSLKLKVGAQVMFTRNDIEKRWANGTIATVSKLASDEIQVTMENGNTYVVPVCSWDSYSYVYDKTSHKMHKEQTGTYSQFPLRLAWAITIHKSQGMSFDKMYLDLRRGMFASGQLYVALSRVRSLDGLFLSAPIIPLYAYTNREVINFANEYNDERMIQTEMEFGKIAYQFINKNDYDGAARQYLLFTQKYAVKGDVKCAMHLAKRFLDTVRCDEELFGCVKDVTIPVEINHWTSQFLVSLLYLYAKEYEKSLMFIDKVLALHHCKEALYIKTRCLMKLERYEEAEKYISQLENMCDDTIPDRKVLSIKNILKELQTQKNDFAMLGHFMLCRPEYDRAM
jgi:tetratricopeptide (TPR) repeat protein